MKLTPSSLVSLLFAALLLPLVGCGGSSDDDGGTPALTVRIATVSVAAAVQTDFDTGWGAFTADEATSGAGGTDLNGDGDVIDQVVFHLNLLTGVQGNAGVAVRDFRWLGQILYLVVDEAQDGVDWSLDGFQDDRVLLSLDPSNAAIAMYMTDLRDDGGADLVRAGEWLFFNRGEGAVMANTSTLWAIHDSTPGTVHQVMTNDTDPAGLTPRLISSDEELVFIELDEVREARDLNGDGDLIDEHVLALLDGRGTVVVGGYEFPLRNTQSAMLDATTGLRAYSTDAHDWQVGFVVDETGQGAVNLNEPGGVDSGLPLTWSPTHCIGLEDADTLDQILQVISFRDWDDDPVANPPLNTGLIASDRIVMAPGWVGVISEEAQEGTCDLNGDGDLLDEVFRWTAIASPVLPPGTVNDYFAVGRVAGGLEGIGELNDSWVMTVSEADDLRDLNMDGFFDLDIVQWLDPAAGTTWTENHGTGGASYAAASWMGPSSDGTRLGIAFDELSNGVDLNNDGDQLDSVPTFAQFIGTPTRLAFPGFAAAEDKNNAGIVYQNGWAFYRISEAEDDRDWNNDGNKTGFMLIRSRLSDGTTQLLSRLNFLGIGAVQPDLITGASGGTFLFDELLAGDDVNGDGVLTFALFYYAI